MTATNSRFGVGGDGQVRFVGLLFFLKDNFRFLFFNVTKVFLSVLSSQSVFKD